MADLVSIDVSVGGGGDYTGLDTALDTEAGDISASTGTDEYYEFNCRRNGGGADTTAVTVAGWTLEAANYVEIIGETLDPTAIWDDGKYVLEQSGNANGLTLTGDDTNYWRITGLQIYGAYGSAWQRQTVIIGYIAAAGTGYVRDCLIKGNVTGSYHTTGIYVYGADSGNVLDLYVINNFVYGFDSSGGYGIEHAQRMTPRFWNNTVWGGGNGTGMNMANVAATLEAYNNVSYNNATDWVGSIDSGGYNASDDGTHLGSNGVNCSSDPFEDSGGLDFHLATGSELIGAGYDLSGSFTTDIDGDTRSSWDIGADEYVGATVHAGQCSMTASGTVTAAATAIRPAVAAMTGSGTVTAAASAIRPAASAMTGSGSVTSAATAIRPGASSMTGSGSVTAAASAIRPAVVSMTGSGTLTSSATIVSTIMAGVCSMTASGTLTVASTAIRTAAVAMTGTGVLTVVSAAIRPAVVSMTASGTLTASADICDQAHYQVTTTGTVRYHVINASTSRYHIKKSSKPRYGVAV